MYIYAIAILCSCQILFLFIVIHCFVSFSNSKRLDYIITSCPQFYRPQRSCGKVMFLHLSVILFTGGLPPPWADTSICRHPSGQTPPWADTPWADISLGRHPPGQTPTWADTHPWADTPQADTPQAVHAGIWSTSRQYASYWNAFLFIYLAVKKTLDTRFSPRIKSSKPEIHGDLFQSFLSIIFVL